VRGSVKIGSLLRVNFPLPTFPDPGGAGRWITQKDVKGCVYFSIHWFLTFGIKPITMEPDRHLKSVIKTWTHFGCSDAMADAIKAAIRKDQEEEHLFCKEFVRKQVADRRVEGQTFEK